MQPVLLEGLAVRLGLAAAQQRFGADFALPAGESPDNAELLIAEHLLLSPPANHYAPPELLQEQWLPWLRRGWQRLLQPGSAVVSAAAPDRERLPAEQEGQPLPVAQPVRRIGELLLEKKAISRHQLEIAIAEQKKQGQPLGKVLTHLGFVSEEAMRDLLGEALEQETVDLSLRTPDAEAIRHVPKGFARRYGLLPLAWQPESAQLTVAMSNTFNMAVLDKLQSLLPKGVVLRPLMASESELLAAIDRFYGFDLSVDGILREIETGEVELEAQPQANERLDHPMVRLVDALLTDAIRREASDMHINPMASFTQIRYRIDGVLQEARILNRSFFSGLCVRIKVMGGLDIAETRAPQDGHFSRVLANVPVDFRLSTQPTVHGENIVLRILNRSKGLLGLHELGLTEENSRLVRQVMGRPHGIILVSGPTGCGKTTTLYSMLSTLNAKKSNVMTLEDPVEYLLDAILQTSVNRTVELDFSSGVRSILRQDPDIILVGEIRDLETAQMALRAAMTGHQVYSTLHANSAVAAISRLLNIGLRADMLAGNMIGVLAQRLIRKLCLHCRQPRPPTAEEQAWLGPATTGPIYGAVGCPECHGTGYKGRLCVMEGVMIDDEFDDLIASNAPQSAYRRLVQQKGLLTLQDFARRRVLDGTTALEEVARVFGLLPVQESHPHA
ncbi:MAG: Flp pilus assembly complex ATPase component TadA [Magnetococcales bacterium]|nr:Flp pilus assembly complex ATPase component TadA [Magnetococcales bacterium]